MRRSVCTNVKCFHRGIYHSAEPPSLCYPYSRVSYSEKGNDQMTQKTIYF